MEPQGSILQGQAPDVIRVEVGQHHHVNVAHVEARAREALFQETGAGRHWSGAGVDQNAMRTCIHQQWRVRHQDLLGQTNGLLGIIPAKGTSRIEMVTIWNRITAEVSDADRAS